jgi:hypothetical protein
MRVLGRTPQVVALALGAAVVAAGAASSAIHSQGHAGTLFDCGGGRWKVKTLSDAAAGRIRFRPRWVAVKHLRSLEPPPDLTGDSARRRGPERRVFRIRVRLIEAKLADDRDIHLVVSRPRHPGATMIVEFPNARCNGAASAIHKAGLIRARRAFLGACGPLRTNLKKLHGIARVRGVGFFDTEHGQTGRAPNAFELHPVLGFRRISGC